MRISLEELGEITMANIGDFRYNSYLVNRDYLLLTKSKTIPEGEEVILKKNVKNVISEHCFSEFKEHKKHTDYQEIFNFIDWRGEDVVGISKYIEEPDWCLVTEVDKSKIITKRWINFIWRQIFLLI